MRSSMPQGPSGNVQYQQGGFIGVPFGAAQMGAPMFNAGVMPNFFGQQPGFYADPLAGQQQQGQWGQGGGGNSSSNQQPRPPQGPNPPFA